MSYVLGLLRVAAALVAALTLFFIADYLVYGRVLWPSS